MKVRVVVGLAIAVPMMLAHTSEAQPSSRPSANQCGAALTLAQEHADERKLLAAREQLITCAQSGCPTQIRAECASQLEGVRRRTPAIVVSVKSASGDDVSDAQLSIDGARVNNSVGGLAHDVDPGPHRLKVEHAGAIVEREFIAEEGNHGQRVEARFAGPPGADPDDDGAQSTFGGRRMAGGVLGIFGIVGLVTAGGLGVATLVKVSQSNEDCDESNNCHGTGFDLRSEARSLQTAGFVALGVGAAATVVGTVLFSTATPSAERAVQREPAPDVTVIVRPFGAEMLVAW